MPASSSAHLRRGDPPLFDAAGNALRLGLDLSVSRRELLIGSVAGTAAMLALAALRERALFESNATSQRASGWSPYPLAESAPMSLSSLDSDLFAALVGERFTATSAGQTATLVLRDVTVAEAVGERPREVRPSGFSLMFEVSNGELAESGVVAIENAQIGRHDLFVHRVGLVNGSAPRYEAVFN